VPLEAATVQSPSHSTATCPWQHPLFERCVRRAAGAPEAKEVTAPSRVWGASSLVAADYAPAPLYITTVAIEKWSRLQYSNAGASSFSTAQKPAAHAWVRIHLVIQLSMRGRRERAASATSRSSKSTDLRNGPAMQSAFNDSQELKPIRLIDR
jgi:hypothetical protein